MTLATDSSRPDLGGNQIGGDPCSYSPNLWHALLDEFEPVSVLDVGCGEGHAVKWFREHVVSALGLDGLRANVERAVTPIMWIDLTQNPLIFPVGMVWSCEVVEHIEERYIENLLMTLCNGDVIAMTHGLPGQVGWHHVNNQPPEYWIERICARGYDALDPEPFREIARRENDRAWFARSGLIFRKCPAH